MKKETFEQIQIFKEKINEERKAELQVLVDFLSTRKAHNANLTFICVHNSRRSHLSQVWAQIAAHHYGFNQVNCYSGGTEVTEMYPKIAETLNKQGISVQKLTEGTNPVYAIKYAENEHPIIGFSKLYDDGFNPQSDFGAIMVCSSADTNCPYISTAAKRILLPFEDPKSSDGTPQQDEVYAQRSIDIASNFFWVFEQLV